MHNRLHAPDRHVCRASRRILLLSIGVLLLCGCAIDSDVAQPKPIQEIPVEQDDPATNDETGAGQESVVIDPDVVSYDEYRDPLMPMNRVVFGFNSLVSRYALLPVGKAYAKVVPEAVDRRVDSFFKNAATPISIVNNLVQGKVRESGTGLARFAINTTLGLVGLFDPAQHWFDLERNPADFAGTLAHYDAGYGFYLVLPFFGASDARNAVSRGMDYFLHPIPWVLDDTESFAILSFGFFEEFAQDAENFEQLLEKSDDPYLFIRNLHLQSVQRDAAYRE